MKKSELVKLIVHTIKEEFTKAPKFGDIDPTDEKTGERPSMANRPKDGMDITQHKKMLWAEGKDLPEDGKISDVKIPFQIVKLPTIDIIEDCTVVGHGKIDKLDLNDPYLYATQDHLFLTHDELIAHYNSGTNKKLPVVVVFPNGVKLIQDGHHRLSIQKLSNKSTAIVEIRLVNKFEDVEEETEDFIKNLGPTINEMNAVGGGAVGATSDGSAFGSQKKNHEMMWQEELLGKRGPNGPTYFQMGSSLPDALYNQKDGKPSRDPGIAGLKEDVEDKSTLNVLKAYSDENLYVCFSDVPKLGINPRAEDNFNPKGVYGIPVTSKWLDELRMINKNSRGSALGNDWFTKRKFIILFSVNEAAKILKISGRGALEKSNLSGGELTKKLMASGYNGVLSTNHGMSNDIKDEIVIFPPYSQNISIVSMLKNTLSIDLQIEDMENNLKSSPKSDRPRIQQHLDGLKKHHRETRIKTQESINPLQEKFYHGTTIDLEPGQYILPPNDTGKVSEKGRLKNLDKIFFTQDLGSAKIYAGRAKHSIGGTPKVYLIEPENDVEVINKTPGSTVFMAPKAKVIKRVL